MQLDSKVLKPAKIFLGHTRTGRVHVVRWSPARSAQLAEKDKVPPHFLREEEEEEVCVLLHPAEPWKGTAVTETKPCTILAPHPRRSQGMKTT